MRIPSVLPPARFFLGKLPLTASAVFGKRRVDQPLRPPRIIFQGQKTFSAGPRSFTSGELWFPPGVTAWWGQPVF